MKKILILMMAVLILFSMSYANNVSEEVEAGYTPDDKVMYNFDKFGEWVSLRYAQFQGEEKYEMKKAELLQERLAEYKLVKEETKPKFRLEIEEKIQARDKYEEKVRKRLELSIEDSIKALENRDLNSSQKEFLQQELEYVREQVKQREELSKRFKFEEDEKVNPRKPSNQFGGSTAVISRVKPELDLSQLNSLYPELLSQMEGKTFKVIVDGVDYFAEIENGELEIEDELSEIDYTIQVLDLEALKGGNVDSSNYGDYVKIPLSLKLDLIRYSLLEG